MLTSSRSSSYENMRNIHFGNYVTKITSPNACYIIIGQCRDKIKSDRDTFIRCDNPHFFNSLYSRWDRVQFCPLSSRFRSRFPRREISRILVFLVGRYGGKVCGVNLHSCFRVVQRQAAAATSVNVTCHFYFPFSGGWEEGRENDCLLKEVGVSRNFPWPDSTSLSRRITDTFHRVKRLLPS